MFLCSSGDHWFSYIQTTAHLNPRARSSRERNGRYQRRCANGRRWSSARTVRCIPRQLVARASSLPPILNPSNTTVGYVYSTLMMTHTNTRGHHEEQPDRISRIFNLLKDSDCLTKMRRLPIRPVAREEALLVHSEALWEKIMAIQCRNFLTMQ